MTTEVINLDAATTPAAEPVACKFVVVGQNNHYLIIFGPLDRYPYHANLLEKFCRDRRIETRWIKRPDQLQIENGQYRVLGGGYLDMDNARKKVRLHGSSKAYGYFDADVVRLITANASFFQSFTVQIES